MTIHRTKIKNKQYKTYERKKLRKKTFINNKNKPKTMDLTNKEVALITIFLVLTGAVAFNLGDITGSATIDLESSRLKISPVIVSPEENIKINIYPGKEGSSSRVEFFTQGSKIGETPKICREKRCYDNSYIIYEVPSSWQQGLYIGQIFDYETGRYVKSHFNLE